MKAAARIDVVARQQEGEHAERAQRQAHHALGVRGRPTRDELSRYSAVGNSCTAPMPMASACRRPRRPPRRARSVGPLRDAATVERHGDEQRVLEEEHLRHAAEQRHRQTRRRWRPARRRSGARTSASKASSVHGAQAADCSALIMLSKATNRPPKPNSRPPSAAASARHGAVAQQAVHTGRRPHVVQRQRGVVAERPGQQTQRPVERVVDGAQRVGGERLAEHLERRPQRRPVELREQPHDVVDGEDDGVLVAEHGDALLERAGRGRRRGCRRSRRRRGARRSPGRCARLRIRAPPLRA